MHRSTTNRKTTPKVRDGKVQRKNRHAPTRLNSLSVGIDPIKKGKCGRQVVSKDDVWKFIRLIPDWKRVSSDLDLIYLSSSDNFLVDGYYECPQRPLVTLNCWEEDLATRASSEYVRLHQELFDRLGVEVRKEEGGLGVLVCQFDEDSARAFQLLHIFLHELGHHHYRITKGRGRDAGDEKYAESYALKTEKKIWKRYCEVFRFQPKKLGAVTD